MPDTDLFGDDLPPPRKRGVTVANGYADEPGSGPDGETCKTCAYFRRKRSASTYFGCILCYLNWTHGTGSDIRAGSPACRQWEAIENPKEKA